MFLKIKHNILIQLCKQIDNVEIVYQTVRFVIILLVASNVKVPMH